MKYSILFMVDARGFLRMIVRYKGKRITYNVGFNVDVGKWNKETQRCKRNTTHGDKSVSSTKINAEIQRYEDAVNFVASSFRYEPTIEEFKAALNNELSRKKDVPEAVSNNFFALYERYIKEQKVICGWSMSVIYKHWQIYKNWKDFNPNMDISLICEDTLNSFTQYLISLKFRNETIQKKISMSKWFFRWLISKEYLSNISFTTYKSHLKKSNKTIVFLTWDELMRVYNHQFDAPYLDRVRDVFCFCCFSSLRYSDVYALKKTDVYNDAIHIVTQKTNDKITIELNDYTKEILAKYKDLKGDKALPVISNQKMNDYLKEVCKQCDITEDITNTYYIGGKRYEEKKQKWELIGTHSGRRTFICNALMMGITPNVVMKWTGHSDYQSMKPYIEIADEAKKKSMDLFNKKW